MSAILAPRVLIVDDQLELLHELASYFRRKGVTVVTAGSFSEGRQILDDETQSIDVLISDARMPDGNGIELLRTQLNRVGDRSICILMTGHLDEREVADMLGEVKVFFKPFRLSDLYHHVRSTLARSIVPGIAPVSERALA